MKLAVISFTPGGAALCERLKSELEHTGYDCFFYVLERFLNPTRIKAGFMAYQPPLKLWTKTMFRSVDGIIYISAAGIAVRAIAPFLNSKTTDPAVVSIDEKGQFVVPLLSGHLGGANELAAMLADLLGAVPVISTATDLNHQFAVDVFARKHELAISDMNLAKMMSAQLLESRQIGFFSDFLIEEEMPPGFTRNQVQACNLSVTYKANPLKQPEVSVLRLIPKVVFMGIGCRSKTPKETIARVAKDVMKAADVDERSIAVIASIDLKQQELGLVSYARELGACFTTYCAKELNEVEGNFHESEFVKQTTGVGNVCERAAVLAADRHGGFDRFLAARHAEQGVTVSLVLGIWNNKRKRDKMDVLIFGGTTEGRQLAAYCSHHEIPVTVSVATEYGRDLLPNSPYVKIRTGRLSQEEIGRLLEQDTPRLVIDATHPYAALVTGYIRQECEIHNIPYTRVIRNSCLGYGEADALPDYKNPEGSVLFVNDVEQAARMLSNTEGNILLTTGSKEMHAFLEMKDRIYLRVLPTSQVMELCEKSGFSGSHIIGMQGPFSKELNAAMMRQIHAAYLVTKESGSNGGFEEKLEAARECGVTVIVIGRPFREEGETVEQVIGRLKPFAVERKPQVSLIGMGMGGCGQMTVEALKALKQCDMLLGSERMLQSVKDIVKDTPMEKRYLKRDVMEWLLHNHDYDRIGILYSGDTGFYSGATQTMESFAECKNDYELLIYPGIPSVAYFCARLKTSWEEVRIVSCHGRECDICAEVEAHKKVFCLLGGKEPVKKLCQRLIDGGYGHAQISVGERLSYPEERIVSGNPKKLLSEEFNSLSVALICREEQRGGITP